MLKRTPLYPLHQALGARLVEFGGWDMPVQYTSIVDEHNTVRTAAGVFDICHMGEVFVSGPGAEAYLNRVLTNDIRKLAPGQGQYTLMCLPSGGVVDDLYAYRLAANDYLLIINASRIEEDVAWLISQSIGCGGVMLQNASDAYGAIAVQGPKVAAFIDDCFDKGQTPSVLKKNEILQGAIDGVPVYAGRTGYTGEDGFELIAPAHRIGDIWNRVLEKGAAHGIKPAGLGARDTLRTEMGYPLYGHELDEMTTPIEAGLGYFVALAKGDFNGRDAMALQKLQGTGRKCVAFKMAEKSAPPRPGYSIMSDAGAKVGVVVSGTQSPSLSNGIGMGYVPPAMAAVGSKLLIEIRGKTFAAEVVKKPIYQKK